MTRRKPDDLPQILLVEDDELMRVSLEDRLVIEGFSVASAATVDGARLLLQHGPRPSLVITDVRLPDGNGAQVFDLARARHPGLPVILMTAYVSVADAVRLVKAGALDYLEKPFKLEDLIETARLAVEDRTSVDDKDLRSSVENAERTAIIDALERCGWAISRTAAHLGISRKNLWEKMRRHQIER